MKLVPPILLLDEPAEPVYVLCSHIDQCEAAIDVAAANLVMKWELADPRDRWKHSDEFPPPIEEPLKVRPYRTAESTVAAFWYVVRQRDCDQLEAWLNRHSRDKKFLLGLLKP